MRISNRLLSWTSAEFFFTLNWLTGVSFAILSNDISSQLHLDKVQLGLLGGVFLFSYAISQVLYGIIVPKVPLGLLLTLAAILSAGGTLLFSQGTSFPAALLGRVIMGLGLSSTMIGILYLTSREYKSHYAFVSSLVAGLANISGALLGFASAFLPLLVNFRTVYLVFAALLLISAVLIFFEVGDERASTQPNSTTHSLGMLFRIVLSSRHFWAAFVYYCGTLGTQLPFANLWNIQFQMNLFHRSVQHSTVINAMIPLGVTFGSIAAGFWAERSGFITPLRFYVVMTFLFFLVALIFPLSEVTSGIMMFLLGMGLSGSTLALAALQQNLPTAAVPLGTTIVITAACLYGGLLQPLIGLVISSHKNADPLLYFIHYGNPDFPTYQYALICLMVGVLFAVIASFFLSERSINCSKTEIEYSNENT
jgi:MFS family permease